jgi:hypothetical protein
MQSNTTKFNKMNSSFKDTLIDDENENLGDSKYGNSIFDERKTELIRTNPV